MYFIAEIGVNHNGDMNFAKKLIDLAKESGANAVKFQLFKADRLALKKTPKTRYQIEAEGDSDSHHEMLKRLEVNIDQLKDLSDYCAKKSIDFLCTPYDQIAAQELFEIGCKNFKTASADLVDYFLHKYLAKVADSVIISVGMSTMGEIEDCLKLYENSSCKVILLHCVTNYPCSDESMNLKTIGTLQSSFGLPVGLSDHSEGSVASVIASSMGCDYVEKHFTEDKNLYGPDHRASATPHEFKMLVDDVKKAELQLGSSVKKVRDEEVNMLKISRKSIFASIDIESGEIFSEANLKLSRPGGGLHPMLVQRILGMKATRKILQDEQVKFGDFE